MCLLPPGLLCMMIIPVSSGTVYIQSGSDITGCNMKCPEDDVTVEMFRECGGKERTLLENLCFINDTKSHDPRLQLDTGSGCWILTHARKDDSCVYKVWCHCAPGYVMSSTEIRVLDPVLISNITSNCSRLGEETAVSVQFSGEESAVTWEVDGEPLPERYRLIDDNRTLIILGVQRDDAERRFRVRITNPVSEEIREYRLINDTMFIRMLEPEDPVLIYNITSIGGRLGEEMAVSVHFAGEESAVTWEVDGEPLPERYRLIDDNRTLIIPGVQRDDAERRFRVRITNPVSEGIREYRLEVRDLKQYRKINRLIVGLGVGLVVSGISVAVIVYTTNTSCCQKTEKTNVIAETVPLSDM
ncbi:uncharacterized protein LOC120918329 [Rana temporaria]|uniref:uncharacterized protein LOC120918329 n=1 Tax=Rana temporaria TaxID=8407 RepID=UPI001AACF9CE|nr:uncharacterized protein LOC120918329 [Rana temporaria]